MSKLFAPNKTGYGKKKDFLKEPHTVKQIKDGQRIVKMIVVHLNLPDGVPMAV